MKQISLAIRNAKLEALIEAGAFRKRSDDEADGAETMGAGLQASAGEDGSAASGAGGGKREKTAEELTYKHKVAAWQGAAKKGDVSTLER